MVPYLCRLQSIKNLFRTFSSQSAVLFTLLLWVNVILFEKGALSDDCRSVQFEPPTKDKILQNHVIRKFEVSEQSNCELSCYHEPSCVSYNYGPDEFITDAAARSCELNDRSYQEVSIEDFVRKENYIYREVLISKCQIKPCLNNETCQIGFTAKGYRCISPRQHEDTDECTLGIHKCTRHTSCSNLPGSFTCTCKIGYTGDGFSCTAVPLSCTSFTHLAATNTYEVNVHQGSWPRDGFCRVIRMDEVLAGNPYVMTVDFRIAQGLQGVVAWHPGVMYNVIDGNNFDFVYLRPHSTNGLRCIQLGYQENGIIFSGRAVDCTNGFLPNGFLLGGVWSTLRLVVSSTKTANVLVNGRLLASLVAHFDTRGHGGFLVANGYKNIVYYRAFRVDAIYVSGR